MYEAGLADFPNFERQATIIFTPHTAPLTWFTFALIGILVLSACAPLGDDNFGRSPLTTTPAPGLSLSHMTTVTSIEFLMLTSFPVQVHTIIKGILPDACTTIQAATATRAGNDFALTLTTARDTSAVCAQTATPFEQDIPLDVYGLPTGAYTASANGVSATFELTRDNVLPSDPTPVGIVDAITIGAASISGSVWADRCVLLGGEGVAATPSGGCLTDGSGGYRANGEWGEGEGRLSGLVVAVAPGQCPGDAARTVTAVTDFNGAYRFEKLSAGDYCVSIDSHHAINLPLLLPGDWTVPAVGMGYVTVALGAGEDKTDVNFGWDAQFK